jgi:hypothetical protein
VELFQDFCKREVIASLPERLQKPLKDTVIGITPLSDSELQAVDAQDTGDLSCLHPVQPLQQSHLYLLTALISMNTPAHSREFVGISSRRSCLLVLAVVSASMLCKLRAAAVPLRDDAIETHHN